ncbi:pro-neuregulin-4, membrane-bound isoform isoform X2 [Heteronotia binoei]|uniref:pro-neuregulin-4, membrane-bound isoform isoform X2 n=1 Tax=Heteronotia binoei TaxID=13085 RepID=UPI00292E2667|nr:pro-neuregulin-4, membrane-bound isoform isoform X2 [Heteronotia binoei]
MKVFLSSGQFPKNSLWPGITSCCQNNMRTDHEELCGSSYGSFCMNGGICYMIPTVSSPFCRCIENYTGARCEENLLPSIKNHARGELVAAFLASVVVLSVLVAGAIFLLCRKGHIPRANSIERGDNLTEANDSNGCNR